MEAKSTREVSRIEALTRMLMVSTDTTLEEILEKLNDDRGRLHDWDHNFRIV